jgi:aspartyl-tRNA(Asn)/glutamyl-tRNA(Gln) amidotransferase subunit B
MEQGNFRCDANVSIRRAGTGELGTRTELKNLNSFKFVQQAIDEEVARQIETVGSGSAVVQQTRSWDPKSRTSSLLRSKEEAHDYRYFPEPDLPDLVLDASWLERERGRLPELPAARRARFRALGLSDYDAGVLTEDVEVADFFEAALAVHDDAKAIANWVSNDVLRALKGRPLADLPVEPQQLAALVVLVDRAVISSTAARTVFEEMLATGGEPEEIVDERGLRQLGDDATLVPIVEQVIAANPKSVEAFRAGKERALGFLVGQVMKASAGRANPAQVRSLLLRELAATD